MCMESGCVYDSLASLTGYWLKWAMQFTEHPNRLDMKGCPKAACFWKHVMKNVTSRINRPQEPPQATDPFGSMVFLVALSSSLGRSIKPCVTMGSTCGCPKIHSVGKAWTCERRAAHAVRRRGEEEGAASHRRLFIWM